jgi:hypothetical protein
MNEERCKRCKIVLITEDELAEKAQERREWDYYHNDSPKDMSR